MKMSQLLELVIRQRGQIRASATAYHNGLATLTIEWNDGYKEQWIGEMVGEKGMEAVMRCRTKTKLILG